MKLLNFFPGILSAEKKSDSAPDPNLTRNVQKVYLYIREVDIQFNLINHNFKLEFFASGKYFVKDENNFIFPL